MRGLEACMKKTKIESLQALRALAFLGVFLTHCEVIPNLGGWGVSVFIVLSGFLMVYSYNDRLENLDISVVGNARFAASKMKRLYPLHLIMMFSALLITVAQMYMGISSLTIVQLLIQIVLQSTLLQALIPFSPIYHMPLNGLTWYLSVSMILYFFFPWILRRIKKVTTPRLLWESFVLYLIIFVVTAVDQLLVTDNEGLQTYFNYVCPFLRLCDFSMGCNFGMIFLRNRGRIKTGSANCLEAITVLLTVASIWFLNIDHKSLLGQTIAHSAFLYAPTSIALVYLFAEKKGFFSKLLTNKLFTYIGDISPYGYLIHQKVIAYLIILFTHILGNPLNDYVRTILTAIITIGAIYAYKELERKLFFRKKIGA